MPWQNTAVIRFVAEITEQIIRLFDGNTCCRKYILFNLNIEYVLKMYLVCYFSHTVKFHDPAVH